MAAKKKSQKSAPAKKQKDTKIHSKPAQAKPLVPDKKASAKKTGFDWKKFLFGHDKITRSDMAEAAIMIVLSALLIFIILKSYEII